MTFGPHVPSSGPSPARICILAEAPGSEESAQGKPLVGPSGYELRRMLATIGANLDECRKVNVFSRQPNGNNLALYGGDPRVDDCVLLRHLGPLTLNPITYCRDLHAPDVERCWAEIAACDPNVVIALGNTACWALGLGQGIGALRGSVHEATIPGLHRALKTVPTYHPSAILRQWDQRVIAIADLQKALDESHSPEFKYDSSELWIQPTLEDIAEFDALYMRPATICAADIETKRGQITCLSFAPSVERALVIPFWIEGPSPNYWPTAAEEARAWRWVQHWMERPDLTVVGQNFSYDLQYLQRMCSPRGCSEDTMLMHHSLYSELQKGLGFLGSIYSNSPSWKKLRTYKKEEQLKRDD